ncbi:AAA family ATPase [Dehalobacter restrictus]|jgi:hypothetical protein|uniref:coiled-coil domain-containing protein n=1 Tax=Dehalobacter restrictus TaxID=55583 RepID=UPI00338E7240
MNKEFTKIVEKLYDKYSNQLTKEEIIDLLNIEDTAIDIPLSTGKRLIIEYIEFSGEKQTGEPINFKENFSSGINMIIADNLKGKSTLFKIIKTALVGNDNYIKPDVKQWIKCIVLGFKINDKRYTISMDLEKRTKGKLYNCSFEDYLKDGDLSELLIFEANSNIEYESQIQEFFFNQFSYFSMKWTQKTSLKDSNELIESGSSWKTYFKTIYLESRDSTSFYGGQDQKTFQMLLALEHTQLINKLTVKKELTQSSLSKQLDVMDSINDDTEVSDLKADLKKIEQKLNEIRNSRSSMDLLNLKNQRKSLKLEISELNVKLSTLYKQRKVFIAEKELKKKELDGFGFEYSRISNEIYKTQRFINDINEYLEVGQFFSALEIKYCPSCNHQVVHSNTETGNTCPLCHEIAVNDDVEQKHNYSEKADELEKTLKQMLREKELLGEKKKVLNEEVNRIEGFIESHQKDISRLEENDKEDNLDVINRTIEKIQNEYDDSQEKELIAQQAVLMFRLAEKEKGNSKLSDVEKLKVIIKMFDDAIIDIDNLRFEKSKKIIEDLKKSMLNEIHDFGLTSITDIIIDKKFNITYVQNNVMVKFSEIAEGEQLRVKLAFYLSLIQLDIEKNHGRHTRFLIVDSPNKEEGDTAYLEGLKEVLNQIQLKYYDQLQIIIGTATREFAGVVKNEKIYEKGEYLF